MCISGSVKRIVNFIRGCFKTIGPTPLTPLPARKGGTRSPHPRFGEGSGEGSIDKSRDRSRAPSTSVATPAVSYR